MASTFAWMDQDDAQRRKMLAVIELFKEDGTVDELGIGGVRDTIADVLFPGMSVLHSRPRYLLFIPWILDAIPTSMKPEQSVKELRRLEIKLIHALLKGGEAEGVIGQQARDKLKNMPSTLYWSALYRYGIRTWDTSIDGYARRRAGSARAQGSLVEGDCGDDGATSADRGVNAYIPKAPTDLLTQTDFELQPEEAGFLRDRLLATTDGSLLAWMLLNTDSVDADWIWNHNALHDLSGSLASAVDHGRRFHTAIHGAPLLYNLLLAERRANGEPSRYVDNYREDLRAWKAEMDNEDPLAGWTRTDFWAFITQRNSRIGVLTRAFISAWLELLESDGSDIADNQRMRDLVRSREIQLKGGRARLVNQGALDSWRGASGLVRLDYRWNVAKRYLADIYRAESIAAAGS